MSESRQGTTQVELEPRAQLEANLQLVSAVCRLDEELGDGFNWSHREKLHDIASSALWGLIEEHPELTADALDYISSDPYISRTSYAVNSAVFALWHHKSDHAGPYLRRAITDETVKGSFTSWDIKETMRSIVEYEFATDEDMAEYRELLREHWQEPVFPSEEKRTVY